MNAPVHEIRRIVSYLIDDERKCWEDCGRPSDHIYQSFAAVERWLTNSPPDAPAQ